jgi:Glyoxalase superfamily protein
MTVAATLGRAIPVIGTTGIDALCTELKGYEFYRPHIEDAPWGARVLTVVDPCGNRLTFSERS